MRGVGPKTAQVVREALAGEVPGYLRRLEDEVAREEPGGVGAALREALRGDCHTHSDWSDSSPIEEMGRTAAALGHAWVALTDHSPRLTVARGLSAERLREQLDVVAELNERWAPFRMLTGIEVDILPDGSLDQEPELLERLDVVVASVHSKLRMDAPAMTRRMVRAVRSPLVDVLGHCTGRLVTGGRGRRPESEFDADRVFAACAESGTAVEVNSRPERLDPPRRLLRRAVAAGTLFAIDTDAHAPGQLDWQVLGCARAEECGVPAELGRHGVAGRAAAGVDADGDGARGRVTPGRRARWSRITGDVPRGSVLRSTGPGSDLVVSARCPAGHAARALHCRFWHEARITTPVIPASRTLDGRDGPGPAVA